jgi:hypothetical protein
VSPDIHTKQYDQTEAQRPTADSKGATQGADPPNGHLGLACSALRVHNQAEARQFTVGGFARSPWEDFLKTHQRFSCAWG